MQPTTASRTPESMTGLTPLCLRLEEGGQRRVSPQVLSVRKPLAPGWAELYDSTLERIVQNGPLAAGDIGADHATNSDDVQELANDFFGSFGLANPSVESFGHQVLYCRGAPFHNDHAFWPNEVFLTVYLGGPTVDFCMPMAGYRQTLQPGDAFLFDPAQPHGVVRPGRNSFIPKDWQSADAREDLCFFVSVDVELTPELDLAFGVTRTPLQASMLGIEVSGATHRLCRRTGKLLRRTLR